MLQLQTAASSLWSGSLAVAAPPESGHGSQLWTLPRCRWRCCLQAAADAVRDATTVGSCNVHRGLGRSVAAVKFPCCHGEIISRTCVILHSVRPSQTKHRIPCCRQSRRWRSRRSEVLVPRGRKFLLAPSPHPIFSTSSYRMRRPGHTGWFEK